MNATRTNESDVLDALVQLATRSTGVAETAIHGDSLLRFARSASSRFGSAAEVVARASRDDPTLRDALAQAIAVGETFFFRHPEHFELVVSRLRERTFDRSVRVWSAGCATGEETYSLAACLSNELASPIEVLGTDLLESQIRVAEAGVYRRWSIRESAPFPYPIVDRSTGDSFSVREDIRRLVRFETHNLLDPTMNGPFDVIFCRNVLIYFTPESAERACENLFAALAEGGVLVFGTMDLVSLPRTAIRVGPSSIQAFTRDSTGRAAPDASLPKPSVRRVDSIRPAARRRPSSVPPTTAVAPKRSVVPRAATPGAQRTEDVAMHVEALARLERGDTRGAHAQLAALADAYPTYVPGMLELAMLDSRLGHARRASTLVRRVLELLAPIADDAVVSGPEPLGARFYRETAFAWLRSKRGSADGAGP